MCGLLIWLNRPHTHFYLLCQIHKLFSWGQFYPKTCFLITKFMSQMKKFHHHFAIGWGAYCRQTDRQTDRQTETSRKTDTQADEFYDTRWQKHRQANFTIKDNFKIFYSCEMFVRMLTVHCDQNNSYEITINGFQVRKINAIRNVIFGLRYGNLPQRYGRSTQLI